MIKKKVLRISNEQMILLRLSKFGEEKKRQEKRDKQKDIIQTDDVIKIE